MSVTNWCVNQLRKRNFVVYQRPVTPTRAAVQVVPITAVQNHSAVFRASQPPQPADTTALIRASNPQSPVDLAELAVSHVKSDLPATSGLGSLTSYQDGSLGGKFRDMPSGILQAYQEGSLGSLLTSYNEGSLGCACSGTKGIGEYFESAVNGLGDILDTTPKKIGAGLALVGALYFVGKKAKLIPNRRKRKSRRSRRHGRRR